MNSSISPPRKAALPAVAVVLPMLAHAPSIHADTPIEEIEVVGTPHDRSPSELAQSVTVLAGESLRRVRGNTLGETLAGELGVSSTSFGSGASRPVIRGLAGARVKILEDGIDALDVSGISVDHAVGVDPLVAEQIEVFRGPTTLLYGSGAVGGVVNTVTERIPQTVPERIDAAIELRADSVARGRSGAVRADGGRNRFAWHVDAAGRDASDYESPGLAQLHDADAGRHVPNSDLETRSAAAGASWLGDRGMIGVSVSGFDSDYGVPGHAHHGEHEEGDAHEEDHAGEHGEAVRIDLEQRRIDIGAEWLGFDRFPEITVRVGVNDYRHAELEDGVVATVFDNDAYESRIEVLHAPWGEWDGAFGLQLGERRFSAVGEEAFVPPVDTRQAGVFLLENRELGRWDAALGARLERVRHDPSSLSPAVSDGATSVSAAFIRRLASDVSFSVNLARSQRVPSAEELYSNGPHLASGTFELGDPALDVETAKHLDIGLRRTDGRIRWALTAFETRYDDFVYLGATGVEDAASGLPVFAYVQHDAKLRGFEAELFATVAELGSGEVDVRLYTDAVDAKLRNGERLPRIPPRRVGGRVQFHDDRLVAGLEIVRYDAQREIAPYETETGGFTMVGFDVGVKLKTDSATPLELLLKGENLLDEAARRHASLVKDLAPLPGRNYSIGFRASF